MDKLKKTQAPSNETLVQIEHIMNSMIAMAQNGHFPFLKTQHNEGQSILIAVKKSPMISPYQSKKILYQALNKCRRHQCFHRKMEIIENFMFDDKVSLTKALMTLAEDQEITTGLIIH